MTTPADMAHSGPESPRASARRVLDLGWEVATDEQRAAFAEANVLPWLRARRERTEDRDA
jgi:hypothetical protein